MATPPSQQHAFPPLQNDTLLRAARGEPVPRVPVWIMRQAGRYLPEFHTVRSKHDFFHVCRTPHLACELTLQPIRRYDLDAAIIFSDILVIPQAMGMEIKMVGGFGPTFTAPLQTPQDLDALLAETGAEKIVENLSYVFDAISLTRRELKGKVPLLGFSGAPWTLMAYMVGGGGMSRGGFDKAKRWLYRYPEASHRLLSILADTIALYLCRQVDAGAQGLQLFDSWAGELAPDMWHTFCEPYIRRIAERLAEKKKQCTEFFPLIVFSKGNAWYALEKLAKIPGIDALSLDYTMDPSAARERVQQGSESAAVVALQGNLDPNALFASPDVIRQHVRKMLQQFGTRAYIANLGHGLMPDHDPEHVRVFIDAVHDISQEMIAQEQQQQQHTE